MRTLFVVFVATIFILIVGLNSRPSPKSGLVVARTSANDFNPTRLGKKQRAEGHSKGIDNASPHRGTNTIFGPPAFTSDWDDGETELVTHESYTAGMSKTRRQPVWVCHRIQKANISSMERGSQGFSIDRHFHLDWQARTTDYARSGYDTGHMAPFADFSASEVLTKSTFKFTNAAPQVGNRFNQHMWAYLEDWCRVQALKANGQICWAITGGYFATESSSSTAGGQTTNPRKFIGTNRIPVPTHFFKILVSVDRNGRPSAIAFAMENRGHDNGGTKYPDFSPYIVSIDNLEELTGLNFLPDIREGSAEERRLEAKASGMWK